MASPVSSVPMCLPSDEMISTPPGPVAQRLPRSSTFNPSGRPLSGESRDIEEHAARAQRAVGVHGIRHPDRFLRIGAGDVENFFVGREGESIGRVTSLVSNVTLPSLAETR